jgi:hypothetical protein
LTTLKRANKLGAVILVPALSRLSSVTPTSLLLVRV